MSAVFSAENIARWRADPIAFIEEIFLSTRETERPFALNPAQRRFLARAFRLMADGRRASLSSFSAGRRSPARPVWRR